MMSNRGKALFRHLWRPAAAVFSGGLLASAFPVFRSESPEVAWLALVPLLVISLFSRPAEAFRWGFLGGLCFWLLSLSWLLSLISAGGPLAGVVAGWLLLAAYCALYTGGWAAAVCTVWRAWQQRSEVRGQKSEEGEEMEGNPADFRPPTSDLGSLPFRRTVPLMVVAPLLWVGFEYLRSTILTGFPWNNLGVSQYRNIGIIQVAEWGGVYAVSALVVVVNVGLALTGMRIVLAATRRTRRSFHLELMLGLLVPLIVWQGGFRRARRIGAESRGRPALVVAAVQLNIPQEQKWSPEMDRRTMKALREQTMLAMMPGVDLLVWPETAAPRPFGPGAEIVGWVADIVREGGVALLAGALEVVPAGDSRRKQLFNSAFLVGVDGEIRGSYRKRHLVPFGEYIPLEKQVPFLQRYAPLGFSCSAGKEQTVFRCPSFAEATAGQARNPSSRRRDLRPVLFSVLICFEDVFPYLARDAVRGGAQLLINQTNDAWFDGSRAAEQHVSHCVFRCVETRAAAIRCTNTGVTCMIDRNGSLRSYGMPQDDRVPQHTRGLLLRPVPLRLPEDPVPFYVRYGDLPFGVPCGIVAALFVGWWSARWIRRRFAARDVRLEERGTKRDTTSSLEHTTS